MINERTNERGEWLLLVGLVHSAQADTNLLPLAIYEIWVPCCWRRRRPTISTQAMGFVGSFKEEYKLAIQKSQASAPLHLSLQDIVHLLFVRLKIIDILHFGSCVLAKEILQERYERKIPNNVRFFGPFTGHKFVPERGLQSLLKVIENINGFNEQKKMCCASGSTYKLCPQISFCNARPWLAQGNPRSNGWRVGREVPLAKFQ